MKKNVLVSYLRRKRSSLIAFPVFCVIFMLVEWLYGSPPEAAFYSIFIACAAAVLFLIPDFLNYTRRERELNDMRKRITTELMEFSQPEDLKEQFYQEMITSLYHKKVETESRNAIRSREVIDYFTMWVHQIKTPIAAMNVLLQTLKSSQMEENCGEETEKRWQEKQALNRSLNAELFQIEQYVGMALSYLRMESMDADLILKPCLIEKVVRQAVRKYSQLFIARKIHLEIGELSGTVLTDEKWISLVVEQILSNAVKYTRRGTVSVRMEAETLVIEDNGIGIRSEDLPRIFERGFTGYNGHEDKKSTGIGLYLCKMVLDRLGHGICVESELGKGTRVRILFGRKKVDLRD